MTAKRIELPQTLDECHSLILEQYDTIDELAARVAQLERELYGPKRERFIDDESTEDAQGDAEINSGLEEQDVDTLPDDVSEECGLPDDESSAGLNDDAAGDASNLPGAQGATEDKSDEPPPGKPPRTSKGRRPRVLPPNAPRVKLYHPLDPESVPPEVLHHPLVSLIRERVLSSRVLGIDETPCPILDPTLPHTRKAYLYAQYGDDSQPYVAYYFADHKTRVNIEAMLQGYKGILQSDAYICYELITAASLDQILPAACWAHGRRKFEPLVVNGKHPKAQWILRQIQKLYDIEDLAREMSNEARLSLRQADSRPIVDEIHTWLQERQQQERPRAAIRLGVNYFLKRWSSFTRFLEDGAIPIDNNRTEAVIKGPVMGKKAWLFLGNQSAGETAAIMYTLMMSCKRHCIDPYAYLLDVMNRIKTANAEQLESLLPDRWLQAHPEAYIEQRAQESHAAAHRKRTRRAIRRRQLAKK